MKYKSFFTAAMLLFLLSLGLAAQGNKKLNEDPNTRSVQGVVADAGGKAVSNANVQLKDMKTLQIRSFITHEDGAYHFAGLSTNVDYELKAATGTGQSSGTKTLSTFDSRKTATIDLKLK
jgi:carboxypeptidase family protein